MLTIVVSKVLTDCQHFTQWGSTLRRNTRDSQFDQLFSHYLGGTTQALNRLISWQQSISDVCQNNARE